MKIFPSDIADLFISEDEFKEEVLEKKQEEGDLIEETIHQFFYHRKEFQEYCELHAKSAGLKPYAILAAHGDTNGEWVYFDGKKIKSIQKWIDSQDGRYGALLIYSCNPGVHTPKSERSLLWVPNNDVKLGMSFSLRDHSFDLIVPKKGIIDTNTIDYELRELKKSILMG